jgi:hypothetical protein
MWYYSAVEGIGKVVGVLDLRVSLYRLFFFKYIEFSDYHVYLMKIQWFTFRSNIDLCGSN